MTGPFESEPKASGGLGSRLRGRKARGAAARELESLLASAPQVSVVTEEQVSATVAGHGVELSRLQPQCRELYRRYLEHCLVDNALSDEEVADLAHLRSILAIPGPVAGEVHEEVACAVYGAAIAEVLSDHRLDPEEEAFLARLRDELDLDAATADTAMEEGRRKARQRYLASVVSSDNVLVASQETRLEIRGSSGDSLEGAVSDALQEAMTVLPGLARVEIATMEADVSGDAVTRWYVKLKAVLDKR